MNRFLFWGGLILAVLTVPIAIFATLTGHWPQFVALTLSCASFVLNAHAARINMRTDEIIRRTNETLRRVA